MNNPLEFHTTKTHYHVSTLDGKKLYKEHDTMEAAEAQQKLLAEMYSLDISETCILKITNITLSEIAKP